MILKYNRDRVPNSRFNSRRYVIRNAEGRYFRNSNSRHTEWGARSCASEWATLTGAENRVRLLGTSGLVIEDVF